MGNWKWSGLTSMPTPHEDPGFTTWVPFRVHTSLVCMNEGQKVSLHREAPGTSL